MSNDLVDQFQQQSAKTINSLKEDLKTIRTGRANPALVENLIVDAYGGQSKLRLFELSTISTEGPSALVVIPFDPSTIGDIEKAILKSPLGVSPQTQGNRIIVRLPSLSTEQREKLAKLLRQKIEEKKITIRNNRDEARKKVRLAFEAKEITEDDKYRLEKEVDNLTQRLMEEIQNIKEIKEREITEV